MPLDLSEEKKQLFVPEGMQESVHGHLGRGKKKKRPSSTCHKTARQKDRKRMQEFDLPYVPGDDFDF